MVSQNVIWGTTYSQFQEPCDRAIREVVEL